MRPLPSTMTLPSTTRAAGGDVVAIHTTASSRHAGPFVIYDESGQVAQAMPPIGKTCSITQTHWFRLADGKVIEHWANRDDLGMARQLGWIPPSPRHLARMALSKRRARRLIAAAPGPGLAPQLAASPPLPGTPQHGNVAA